MFKMQVSTQTDNYNLGGNVATNKKVHSEKNGLTLNLLFYAGTSKNSWRLYTSIS